MKKLSRRKFIQLCSGTAASLGFMGSTLAAMPAAPHLPRPGSFLRFDELTMHDHRIFRGFHAFSFGTARTEIIGSNGTGKSTIAELLATHDPADNGRTNVTLRVSPEGSESVLRRHRELVHVRDDYQLRTTMLRRLSANPALSALEEAASEYILRFFPHAHVLLKRHRPLDILKGAWGGYGTSVAAAWAFLLAERDTVNYRLPLVLDDPFGSMDSELRRAFSALVSPLETQVILLTSEYQLRDSGWPGWRALDEIPRPETREMRGALRLDGSRNRYFLS